MLHSARPIGSAADFSAPPEERLRGCERILAAVSAAISASVRLRAWPKVLAAIRALAIGDPFGIGLAALVVRAGVVVRAVRTNVQIAGACRARVAKRDALAAADLDPAPATEALHPGRLGEVCPAFKVLGTSGPRVIC